MSRILDASPEPLENIFTNKLDGNVIFLSNWIVDWLCGHIQIVVRDGNSYEPVHIKSGITEVTVLGSLVFLFSVNDIEPLKNWKKYNINKAFPDD